MTLLMFIVGLGLYYFIHSLLASNFAKTNLQSLISIRYYRIVYNIVSVVLLGPIVFLYIQSDKELFFQNIWIMTFIGWLIISLGLILIILSLKNYDMKEFVGIEYTPYEAQKTSGSLKTDGLNSYVRHPLYFSMLLILIGLFLLIPNEAILALVIVTAIYLPIGIYFEEKKLMNEYGEEYILYKRQVVMIIPFLL